MARILKTMLIVMVMIVSMIPVMAEDAPAATCPQPSVAKGQGSCPAYCGRGCLPGASDCFNVGSGCGADCRWVDNKCIPKTGGESNPGGASAGEGSEGTDVPISAQPSKETVPGDHGGTSDVAGVTFKDPDGSNRQYFWDPGSDNLYYRDEETGDWTKATDAEYDANTWLHDPQDSRYNSVRDQLEKSLDFDYWVADWNNYQVGPGGLSDVGFPKGLISPDAISIGNTFTQLLDELGVWESDKIFGDTFAPLLNWYETDLGLAFSGNWEESICRVTTDYDSAAAEGYGFIPGTTDPGAYILLERYAITGVDPYNPNAGPVTRNFYTLSFMVSGQLTKDASEKHCDTRAKFEIYIGGGYYDANLNGIRDDVFKVACDDSISYQGGSAIRWNETKYYSDACIKFTDTGQLHPAFVENLDGNEICRHTVNVGDDVDIGDCGFYCTWPDMGGEGGGPGGINWPQIGGGGGGGDDSSPETEVPAPPPNANPGSPVI